MEDAVKTKEQLLDEIAQLRQRVQELETFNHQREDQSPSTGSPSPPYSPEQEFQLITDAVPALIAFIDNTGRLRFINQTYEAWFGRPRSQFLGKHLQEALGETVWASIQPYVEAALAGQAIRFEEEVIYPALGHRYVSATYTPRWNDQGDVVGFVSLVQDITSLKHTEAALRTSEHRFRTLSDNAPVGIYFTDAAGCCTYVNEHWQTLTQLTATQAAGQGWVTALHPGDRQSVMDLWQVTIQTGDPFALEYRFQQPDGSTVWVNGQATALRNEAGDVSGFIGTITDITARKHAEAALQQKQERLDLAQAAAKIGSFEWNFQTNVNIWSKELEALYGLKPGEFEGSYEAWRQWVHPDDVARVEADLYQALSTGEFFSDWRVIWPDGTIRWLYARARVFHDSDGRPVRLVGVNVDISEQQAALHERQQAEAARQRSEAIALARAQELETFMETVPTAVWIAHDPHCHYMAANRTAHELMRLPPGSVLTATPPSGRYPFPFKIQKQGQDLAFDELPMQKAGRTGQAVEAEFEFVFGADDVRSIYGKAVPLRDEQGAIRGVIGAFLDVTERKQMEEALRKSELMFRTLADTVPQFFWITQPDGYHEYFNQRWYDYTGTTLEQVQGEGWQKILHPDDLQRTLEIWHNSLRTGDTYDIEYRLRCAANGEYRWHLGRAFPLHNPEGQIVKWFGSCTDIHDQKLAIEERAQALERERAARMELETASRMKDEFLAVLSHELRSPLNAILGWSRLLRSRQLEPDKVEKALATIERNAQAQTQLIEDLLDISRIIQGQMRLNRRPIDLRPVVQAAIDTVRPTVHTKSIQLEVSMDGPVGLLSGDPDRLQQVIWNLLSNAVKFTPEGGRVEVRLEQVLETPGEALENGRATRGEMVAPAAAYAQLSVSDTGQGISPAFLPYVFDSFRQADSSTTRHYGGLGLGLAIVRNLVELHGGTVSVISQGETHGATFIVRLPLLPEPPPSRQSDDSLAWDSGAPATTRLDGLTILVVDDEKDTREFLKADLEQLGAEVAIASSAREALQLLQALKPDVLLSDIGMPNEDGYALMRTIRALSAHQGGEIPAVALTAYASERDRQRALTAGFQIHIPKPIEPMQLLYAVTKLVNESR